MRNREALPAGSYTYPDTQSLGLRGGVPASIRKDGGRSQLCRASLDVRQAVSHILIVKGCTRMFLFISNICNNMGENSGLAELTGVVFVSLRRWFAWSTFHLCNQK